MSAQLCCPATIREVEPGEFLVTFADVPEAATQGSTFEEALAAAPDALACALEAYLELGRPFPAARSPAAGEVAVLLDLNSVASPAATDSIVPRP